MKLIRFKLNVPFRSLGAGFEVHFLREWDFGRVGDFEPYCLAGLNGSGKSNVLEALAAIFYHLDCMTLDYRPASFEYDEESNPRGFRGTVCTPDAFELEYFIHLPFLTPVSADARPGKRPCHIRITKQAGASPEILWLNPDDFEDDDYKPLVRMERKHVLPAYVLGYSSGHNEILSLPFLKMRFVHFDEYCDRLARDLDYPGRPEGRLIYLDEQFSQAILLCHFLFPCEPVLKVFRERTGIRNIQRFRIIIRRHHRLALAEERLQGLSAKDLEDKSKTTVELTSRLSGYHDAEGNLQFEVIDRLIKCATTHYEDHEPYSGDDGAHDLYLDYWVNDATRRAFQVHFGEGTGSKGQSQAASALNLFQSLQVLLTLNYYQTDGTTKRELYQSGSLYLNETIPLPASHERIIRFKEGSLVKDGVDDTLYIKSLSDGEHQLLHTIGLCLLFRHTSALFLLDEPETHLNPDWRASYISTLRQALEADEEARGVMREVLLTSHSPFIISDCRQEEVLVFTKDAQTQEVTCRRPDFETFGASANAITIKVFGQTDTIGDYAMSKLNALRKRLAEGDDPDELIREANRDLGDSVEKVVFVHQALARKGN